MEGTPGYGPQEPPSAGQPPTQTPAGWYPNPEGGGQRYWDGYQWTQHHAAGPQGALQTPRKSGNGTLKIILAVTGGVLLLIGGCTTLAVVSQDDESSPSSAPSESGDSGVASPDSSSDEEVEPDKQAESNKDPEKPNNASEDYSPSVGPDDPVTVDGLVYRVTGAETAASIGDESIGTGEKADGVFVIVKLKVTSTKGESALMTDDTIKLEAPGGPEYSADSEGSTAVLLEGGGGDEEPFFLRDIQPETSTKGVIVFDVPKKVLTKSPKLRFKELGFGETHAFIELPSLSSG